MLKFILRRLFLEALPTLFVIATLTFFMVRLAPGATIHPLPDKVNRDMAGVYRYIRENP